MTSEKQFVLRDIFKNVKNMEDADFENGDEKEYSNVTWQIVLAKYTDSYYIGFCCDSKQPQNCPIDTEFELSLMGKEVLTLKSKYRFDHSYNYDWDELITIKESQIDRYLIDGNLTVECHVKILKMEGFERTKSKFNEESMKKYSDVVLVVDGEKFYISKAYLASRSPYFDTLLMGQFNESNQSEVVLHGVEVDDFQNFLEILYAEPAISNQNVESVLHVADMYETKCVIKQAEKFLLKDSNKSKKEKFALAVKYNLKGLKESILSKCVNAEEIRSLLPDDLTKFNNETVIDLFKRYLSATTTSHFPITVKTPTGKENKIYVDSTETIISLKSKMEVKEGIPPQRQRIIFNGRQLEDCKTLGKYNIKSDSIVYLVPCFGGQHKCG